MLSDCNTTVNQNNEELIRHGTAAFPLACYHDDLNRAAVPWHWHEELEAAVFMEGEGLITIGSRSCIVRAGDGFFVNSGVLHSCQPLEGADCRFHSLVFHPRLVGGSLESIYYQNYVLPITENKGLDGLFLAASLPWQKEILMHIERAWQACAQENSFFELTVRDSLSRLLGLLRDHFSQETVRPDAKLSRDAARIKQMLQYIQEHYREELTVLDIAGSAAVSESECLRCFHTVIGTTPIRYLREYRIEEAARLLAATREPICDIALQGGFSDVSYFTKTFRELRGCTPGEYRKRAGEKRDSSKNVRV